ncbi:MAG: type II toxin-antitoxin system PemK/MazF family toxin [Patescibacteria group bacterium]
MDIDAIIKWFGNWTKLKIRIHTAERILYFRQKEIWWAALGANVGFEQNGKSESFERPILVLRKFSKDMFLGVPLTSKIKTGFYYFDLTEAGIKSSVILSQVRLMSSKRLLRRMGFIPTEIFVQVKERLKGII